MGMWALGVLAGVAVLVAPTVVCCWLGGWLLWVGVPALLVWLGLGGWAAAGLYDALCGAPCDANEGYGEGYCDRYCDEYV